jgi:hypothetical protein
MSEILKLELVEAVAKQVVEDLERDAIRTIRQRDPDKGKACLDRIEGVTQLLEAIRLAVGSSFYRQRGLVVNEPTVPALRTHSHNLKPISARKK